VAEDERNFKRALLQQAQNGRIGLPSSMYNRQLGALFRASVERPRRQHLTSQAHDCHLRRVPI